MSDDLLVCGGGNLKALDSEGSFAGYAVTFGTPDDADAVGDYFTKKTDYWLEGKSVLPVVYGHGGDAVMKNRRLTHASFKMDETGIWAQGQIDLHDRWMKRVFELIKEGILSWSSGAVGHLTSRLERLNSRGKKVFELENWPIGEISFTPAPADGRNTIRELKSLKFPSLKETIRLSKLSPTELLREKSRQTAARAEALLDPSGPNPFLWRQTQAEHRTRWQESETQRQVVQLTEAQARRELKRAQGLFQEAKRLAEKYEELIGEHRTKAQRRYDYHNELWARYAGLKYGQIEVRKALAYYDAHNR